MRLSVDQRSPYFVPAFYGCARVLLDGEPVTECREASEEAGWADVLVLTPDGGIIWDAAGEPVTERFHGRVEILLDALA
jgi:hypothetical protein